VSRRARNRAGAVLAKRFHVELPPEDDETDDDSAEDFDVFAHEHEPEQPAAMEPAR
jgi:hypothetical protein